VDAKRKEPANPRGYVAFLDVLGFSALVNSDETGEKVEQYRDSVERATARSDVKSVVFSDSIVLTAEDPRPESFLTLVGACSTLMSDLLKADIALRGAIAFGRFTRSTVGDGVFVAGPALIDAYNWETKQDWVGVMIAPTALGAVRDLGARCRVEQAYAGTDSLWIATVQRCSIKFHSLVPLDTSYFDGFAVVPTNGKCVAAEVWESLKTSIEHLEWLRMIAPSPDSQAKYSATLGWLRELEGRWRQITYNRQSQR
jgi:hypothetical protein